MSRNFTSDRGVRAVAVFEFSKGLFGFAVGIVLLALRHKNLSQTAADVLKYLHVSASGSWAKYILEAAAQVTEANVRFLTALAFVYSSVRFVEAYGLWRLRPWAEWFAIVSGAIYLPFEIYEIYRQPTVFKFIIFLLNVALVGYLIYVRRAAHYHKNLEA